MNTVQSLGESRRFRHKSLIIRLLCKKEIEFICSLELFRPSKYRKNIEFQENCPFFFHFKSHLNSPIAKFEDNNQKPMITHLEETDNYHNNT